jgi:NAD-dependent oxidoreductase involved in siderophore biosynthesis
MRRAYPFVLVLCGLGLGLLSCEKLDQARPEGQRIIQTDAIPLEYGDLVAVTADPAVKWAALWFQANEDNTIRVVWVDMLPGEVQEEVVVIPRR